MSKQRASMHNGKKSQKTGKVIRPPHNDTDREKNENVKKEWVKNNIYYNYYDGEYTPENQKGKMPFREAEIAYYNEHYKDALYAASFLICPLSRTEKCTASMNTIGYTSLSGRFCQSSICGRSLSVISDTIPSLTSNP